MIVRGMERRGFRVIPLTTIPLTPLLFSSSHCFDCGFASLGLGVFTFNPNCMVTD
jgi:hypothetical protein